MTTKDVLALALEALGELRKNPALKYEHIFVDTVTAAIKQAQDGALIDEGTKPQAITPETGNAATPEAAAITAGKGQAQEPVGINGLTEAETSASMSVMGLSKPTQEPVEQRCQLCKYEYGHSIGCENNPVDIALKSNAAKHRPTGWVSPVDRYAAPVLFNPYTGEPRDVRDVQSDPQGILIVPIGHVEMVAAPTSKQSLQVAAPKQAEPAIKESLTVPAGYKLVPVEPTQPTCIAGQDKAREWPCFPLRISPIYTAMLAAAPTPPEAT